MVDDRRAAATGRGGICCSRASGLSLWRAWRGSCGCNSSVALDGRGIMCRSCTIHRRTTCSSLFFRSVSARLTTSARWWLLRSRPPSTRRRRRTSAAPGGEVDLLTALRADVGWIPELSLGAVVDDQFIVHFACTRGHVAGAPALGLGPLSVRPEHQRRGVGAALVREVLARAERLGESVVALVGQPADSDSVRHRTSASNHRTPRGESISRRRSSAPPTTPSGNSRSPIRSPESDRPSHPTGQHQRPPVTSGHLVGLHGDQWSPGRAPRRPLVIWSACRSG